MRSICDRCPQVESNRLIHPAKPSQLVCMIQPAKTKSVSPMHDGDALVARLMFHNL